MADEMNWGQLYDSAGSADDALPPGDYEVEVTKAEAKTSKNGKPMYAVTCKVVSGPHAKRGVWHNIVVSPENPNAMRMFFLNMKAFGIGEDFFKRAPSPSHDQVAAALVGRRCKMTLAVQTTGAYAGRNEVKKIAPSANPNPTVGAPGPAINPTAVAGTAAPVPQVPVPTTPHVPDAVVYGDEDVPKPGF